MKKITEQQEKELKVLNENLSKHEESLKEKEAQKPKSKREEYMGNRKWTDTEKLEMSVHMKRGAERDLDEHMINMVERAKRLVQDLERCKLRYFSEQENKKKDYFQYALDEVNNCFSNYRMSDAARKLAKFDKADTLVKVYKDEEVSYW